MVKSLPQNIDKATRGREVGVMESERVVVTELFLPLDIFTGKM
jgi:hypothetical protein